MVTRSRRRLRARSRVAARVRSGALPSPSSLPCADCGRRRRPEDPPHEYDHRSYRRGSALAVDAVCRSCHLERGRRRREGAARCCRRCGAASVGACCAACMAAREVPGYCAVCRGPHRRHTR